MKPPEKLCLIGCAVVVYRPYRTKKGHYVWREYKVLTQPEFNYRVAREKYATAVLGSLHNKSLNEDENIRAIAFESELSKQ